MVTTYSEPVKEFLVYTALRLALFLASAALVTGIWLIFSETVPILWVIVIAFVMSGIGSYFLLNRQREAFARRVDDRARRASTRIEEMRTKEDAD